MLELAGHHAVTRVHRNTTNPRLCTSLSLPRVELPDSPELNVPLLLSVMDHDAWPNPHDESPLGLARQAVDAFAHMEHAVGVALQTILDEQRSPTTTATAAARGTVLWAGEGRGRRFGAVRRGAARRGAVVLR